MSERHERESESIFHIVSIFFSFEKGEKGEIGEEMGIRPTSSYNE